MPVSNTQTNSPHKARGKPFQGVVEINDGADFDVDPDRLVRCVREILGDANWSDGSISLAIVDDLTIRQINARYLNHDYATDVLSFVLDTDRENQRIDGEIVASYETAARHSNRYGCCAANELLLYVAHGCLHLAGYDDVTADEQVEMRRREIEYFERWGLALPGPDHAGINSGEQQR